MSCFCRACRGVFGLSLKLIVHHGSFMRQVVRGRSRLAGPDIILAHRLLKNDVEPRTYVLFTDAAVERLGIDAAAAGMTRYTGKYAHFDERDYFVVSLDRFGRRGEGVNSEMLLGLRSLLGEPGTRYRPRCAGRFSFGRRGVGSTRSAPGAPQLGQRSGRAFGGNVEGSHGTLAGIAPDHNR